MGAVRDEADFPGDDRRVHFPQLCDVSVRVALEDLEGGGGGGRKGRRRMRSGEGRGAYW